MPPRWLTVWLLMSVVMVVGCSTQKPSLARQLGVRLYRLREWRRGVAPAPRHLFRLITVAEAMGLSGILVRPGRDLPAGLDMDRPEVVERTGGSRPLGELPPCGRCLERTVVCGFTHAIAGTADPIAIDTRTDAIRRAGARIGTRLAPLRAVSAAGGRRTWCLDLTGPDPASHRFRPLRAGVIIELPGSGSS